LIKDPKKRGKYRDLMRTPFIQQEKTPTFLPKTTLETAPSMSFIGRFQPISSAKLKNNPTKANINVYAKEQSEKSCDDSLENICEYDYVKFFVDFQEVGRSRVG
jgi:hypothetical protein